MEDYSYRAKLVRVTDGDTVVLEIDIGFRMRATMPIRLVGINTPEMNTPAGKSTRQWVIDWFSEHPAIVVLTRKDPEKYGRWLGVVLPEGGTDDQSLNHQLLTAGLAEPFMTDR